ncbi:MAG: glycosyltransferase family 4 protein [Pseudomonadota bacterium]
MNVPCVRSVLPQGNGAFIVHRALAEGLRSYELRGLNPWLASVPGLPYPAMRRWLRAADVLHLPAEFGVVPLASPPRRVVTLHGYYIDDEHLRRSTSAQRLYYRQILRRTIPAAVSGADRVVVVSHFLADMLAREGLTGHAPVEVIHNGIDTGRFAPVPGRDDRPLRVLFVGNPTRNKGFHLLAAIAGKLPPGVELWFTRGMRRQVHRTAPGLHALAPVPYDRMHEVYQQADVLFFPTFREGFGLCVAEAMACGLPVVSTRCSAIPELLDEGRGGFLLPPDDMAGMVAALNRLLGDAALRAAMGAHNRERAVRDFSLPRMLREYRELFADLRR